MNDQLQNDYTKMTERLAKHDICEVANKIPVWIVICERQIVRMFIAFVLWITELHFIDI